MVNFLALRHMMHHWDSNLPYIVTDGFLQIPGDPASRVPDTYSGAHAPRCLPCHFARDPVLSGLLARHGRGGFAPPPGCPCTPRLACSARPQPDLPFLAGGRARCEQALAAPSWEKAVIFGGYGAVFSRGLFRCEPFGNTSRTQGLLRGFLESRPHAWDGGDLLLSNFLAWAGAWVTDPGSYWWAWEGEPSRSSAFGATAMAGGLRASAERMLRGECGHRGGSGGGGGGGDDGGAAAQLPCVHHFLSAISEHHVTGAEEFPELTELLIEAWTHYHNATMTELGP